jgi:hypothetical protein
MAATIISLPTSAPAPVQNPCHRGRYPRTVVPTWRVDQHRRERAGRMTEAEATEAEQARQKKDAALQRAYERGYNEARMGRLALESLKNLAAVMAYLTQLDDEENDR